MNKNDDNNEKRCKIIIEQNLNSEKQKDKFLDLSKFFLIVYYKI